ncbi:unnamed protein product [Cuscuta epithymum]|uniref:Uncharacterized protein n=1 Tax=Cuscuta epithymum TaxID=186058 RepID=A0AAV0DRI2_9ASTE|nr:unnamed protein product [Cuscuta epithymum]
MGLCWADPSLELGRGEFWLGGGAGEGVGAGQGRDWGAREGVVVVWAGSVWSAVRACVAAGGTCLAVGSGMVVGDSGRCHPVSAIAMVTVESCKCNELDWINVIDWFG